MPKKQLHVLVLAATKGGVGKTTLASAIAVRAAQESKRVALLDTDPQASLSRWWELRGEPENPKIVELDAVAEGIELLISEGWEWVIIDTPGELFDRIENAVAAADLVIVPSRASALDVEAVDAVVDLCREHKKAFGFVLNAVQPTWKLTHTAAAYLGRIGPVLDSRVNYRQAYISAMTSGRSGAEKDAKARAEIEGLWATINAELAKVRRGR